MMIQSLQLSHMLLASCRLALDDQLIGMAPGTRRAHMPTAGLSVAMAHSALSRAARTGAFLARRVVPLG